MEHNAIARILLLIGRAADKHKLKSYAVGGYVRDQLLGVPTKDIDILVLNRDGGIRLAEILHRENGFGRPVVFPRFQTAQTRCQGVEIELVASRSEVYSADSRKPSVGRATLKEDILRRDFTINSLVMGLNKGNFAKVYDVTKQGKKDIAGRVVRCIGDPGERFDEDPLRMLRAVRFACQLEFTIHPAVLAAIRQKRERLSIISAERIREELEKILLTAQPSRGVGLLQSTGLLEKIDPELAKMAGFDQEVIYHHQDLLGHTRAMLNTVKRKLAVRLAVLYHDVGKLYTKRKKEDRYVYYEHEWKSAQMAAESLKRLRFSNQMIDEVCFLVKHHMINYDRTWSDAAVRRLVHKTGKSLGDLLSIRRADILALAPPYNSEAEIAALEQRVRALNVKKVQAIRPPLDGNQIQQILGIPPSPAIARIKQRILDAVLNGEIENSPKAARELVIREFEK